MSISTLRRKNRGAYATPFSGVGMEFYPLGIAPDQSGVVLHEAGFLRRNNWWMFPNVFSPFWRLYYNFQPGHRVIFPHREFPLTPRHMMLIPDRCLFHCHGNVPVSNFWLAFNVARRLSPGMAVPVLLAPSRAELELLRALAAMFDDGAERRDSIYLASLSLLHLVLSREELHWSGNVISEGMQRVLRRIENQYAKPFSVSALAREAGVSARGFSTAFKSACGRSPARHITEVRVREAARRLVETSLSMEEIATETGFPNRDYLSRVFKKIVGESPAQFRCRHTEKLDSGRAASCSASC